LQFYEENWIVARALKALREELFITGKIDRLCRPDGD